MYGFKLVIDDEDANYAVSRGVASIETCKGSVFSRICTMQDLFSFLHGNTDIDPGTVPDERTLKFDGGSIPDWGTGVFHVFLEPDRYQWQADLIDALDRLGIRYHRVA